MAQPISPIVLEFAKANGYRPPSSDETLEQSVTRTMTKLKLDRPDAEVLVLDDQRDELETFFYQRFGQPRSTPSLD